MEPILHNRGFTTKQVNQKRNSDFSFVSERRKKTQSSGFTLVELLVVLAIITAITSVVFVNQNSFNKTLVLANTAYDIALSIRSAETYGTGSRVIGGISNVGYGIHFEIGAPTKFTLFADTFSAPGAPSNCHPTADSTAPDAQYGNCAYNTDKGEKVTDYTLGNGIYISDLCSYNPNADHWSCTYAHGGADGSLNSLDIVFIRPNSNAFMSNNGNYSIGSPVTKACVTLAALQGTAHHYISILSSGNIVANDSSCPTP